MKKIVSIIIIFLIIFTLTLSSDIYAASLDTINVTVDKGIVHPNDNVTVNIEFGEELGAYTFDVAYDNNLLEYVTTDGGTANDTGTKVRVYYYDTKGGTAPRSNMSVTFKGKEGIITSNPTELSITAEGLSNPDASVNYDDITTPIIKDITVEPIYEDYKIALTYEGEVIKNEEKDMKISITSAMGKNYEHTRILAEATTPAGATVKLLGIDNGGLEHDIIQSGWGDATGDSIGGKNTKRELNIRGLFTEAGDYSIKLKLVNRDDSDAEIASQTFTISVKEQATQPVQPQPPTGDNGIPPTSSGTTTENNVSSENSNANNNKPQTLPKTGSTVYYIVIPILTILLFSYVILRKKV